MRVWTIALNTFGSFLRDRLLIVLGVVFVCTVLLMMTPLLAMKTMAQIGRCPLYFSLRGACRPSHCVRVRTPATPCT